MATCKRCEKQAAARGLCPTHWMAWRRQTGPGFLSLYGDVEARFWAKVDRSNDLGCWLWLGTLERSGYGQFFTNATPRLAKAHRFAYELLIGRVPDGCELDHLCHDPAVCSLKNACTHRRCVNPAHLEPVTRRANVLRSGTASAVNARKMSCVKGHPLTGENLYVTPSTGGRQCRACARERRYRRRPVSASAEGARRLAIPWGE